MIVDNEKRDRIDPVMRLEKSVDSSFQTLRMHSGYNLGDMSGNLSFNMAPRNTKIGSRLFVTSNIGSVISSHNKKFNETSNEDLTEEAKQLLNETEKLVVFCKNNKQPKQYDLASIEKYEKEQKEKRLMARDLLNKVSEMQ